MAEQSPRKVATIIWSALVAAVTMFLAVGLYLVFGLGGGANVQPDPQIVPVLIGVSGAVSIVTVALSWLWAVRMKAGSAPPPAIQRGALAPGPEATGVARLVVAGGLCEGGALLAIVMLLVTRDAAALLPFAISYVALLAHFPGDRHWARLTGAPPPGVPRNPMIRG